jgi:hypothetical protein
VGSNPTLSAKIKTGLSSGPILFWGCVDEPTGFDKNRGAIFGRRGPAAAVRSEAEDERPSPAASNPTLSAKFARYRRQDESGMDTQGLACAGADGR